MNQFLVNLNSFDTQAHRCHQSLLIVRVVLNDQDVTLHLAIIQGTYNSIIAAKAIRQ